MPVSMNATIGTSNKSITSLEGEIIPRSFIAKHVVLSYLVSFIGAWTTLELINRRTAMRGFYNWSLHAASSFSMGGIAIWSMYFIGNRAIVLGDGQAQLQIVYNTKFTVISFFLPIIVLFIVFSTVEPRESISFIGVILGGALTGFGICGMHYLGQAGIVNYDCVYLIPFFIGAVIIAVVVSIAALVVFFLFRMLWDIAWWRRPICAVVLASGVSGMHWLASVGTLYRLKKADHALGNGFSRNFILIVVITLSVGGCMVLFLSTLLAQRRVAHSARRAQQVVLAAAIFDNEDRILVTSEGCLPNKKITESWVERSLDDVFNISHPVFLWMFRTTRNWNGVANLLPGMRRHVHRAGLRHYLGSRFENKLLNDHGAPIEDYSLMFRELFCVAACELAHDLHQPLEKIGVLYDDIIPTGRVIMKGKKNEDSSFVDLDIEGLSSGKGQLLFLVKRVGRRESEHLQAVGYRFATPSNVVPLLAATLQVTPQSLNHRIEIMLEYSADDHMLDPGAHMAVFAIRASLSAGSHGFDVLVRKDAKNQLPTMQLPFGNLENWQINYLKTMDSMTISAVIKALNKASKSSNPSNEEQQLAKHLLKTLEALKEESEDPIFNDALLIASPIQAPCRGLSEGSPPGVAILITFRIIVPIHSRAPCERKLIFTPLNFFKAQQQVYRNSRDHDVFAKKIYREFAPLLDHKSHHLNLSSAFASDIFGREEVSRNRGQSNGSLRNGTITLAPGPTTQSYPSKVRYWDKARHGKSSEANLVDANSHDDERATVDVGNSGAESLTVNRTTTSISPRQPRIPAKSAPGIELAKVRQNKKNGIAGKMPKEEDDTHTYIDEMFTITITRRN